MTKAGQPNYRTLLIVLLAALAAVSGLTIVHDLGAQPAGLDFLALWAGGRTALTEPGRIYDFAHVTAVQGLPLPPQVLRPYVNPPSALLLLAPLARLPFGTAYAILMLASLATLLAGARRIGAPWWLVVLPMVPFAVFCGQVTLLIVGLVLLGLSLRERPWLAGLCFAIAGVIKPQVLVLLPLALAAQGAWLTILATGVVALALCGLSAVLFGLQAWLDWLAAVSRFSGVVMADRALLDDMVTPHAWLVAHGWSGAWAWLLAPLAVWGVWTTFRHDAPWPDRLIALLAALALPLVETRFRHISLAMAARDR